MKKVSLSELKKLSAQQLKDGPSLEVTADGAHLGFFILGSAGPMHERLAVAANQVDLGRNINPK